MLSDDVLDDFKLLASIGLRREAAASPQSGRRLGSGSTFEGERLGGGAVEADRRSHGGAERLQK